MTNKRFMQNINTIILSIILTVLVFSIIYLIHNIAFKSYIYNVEYTYVCNTSICEYDNIKDLHKDLEDQFSNEENINEIISIISNISDFNLTTKEVKKSINIKYSNNKINFIIKNKDSQSGFLIYVASQELLTDFNIDELNITFTKNPNYNNYLKYSLLIGSMLGLYLIASDITFFKIEKKEKIKIEVDYNYDKE